MKKKLFGLASLALGLALITGSLAVPALAVNNDPGSVNVSATVPLQGNLTLSTTALNFGSITPGVNQTLTGTRGETATVQTNSTNWSLTQNLTTPFPSGITFQWKQETGGATYHDFSSALGIGSNLGTQGSSYTLDYLVNVPWTISQGTYTAKIDYTLSAN